MFEYHSIHGLRYHARGPRISFQSTSRISRQYGGVSTAEIKNLPQQTTFGRKHVSMLSTRSPLHTPIADIDVRTLSAASGHKPTSSYFPSERPDVAFYPSCHRAVPNAPFISATAWVPIGRLTSPRLI